MKKSFRKEEQVWTEGLQWLLTMDQDEYIVQKHISKGIKRGWKKNRIFISELGWDDIIGRFVYAAQESGARTLVNHGVEKITLLENSILIEINEEKDIEVDGVFLATNWKNTKKLLHEIVDLTIKPIIIRGAWLAHLSKGNPALFPFMVDHENKAITMVTSYFAPKRLAKNMNGVSSVETVLLNISKEEDIERRLNLHLDSCVPGINKLRIQKRKLKKATLGLKWPRENNLEIENIQKILLHKRIVSMDFENEQSEFLLDRVAVKARICANRLFKGRLG